MRHMVRYGIITAYIAAGVLVVAGCGGDDKGTSSNRLTAQDQFDELTTYVNFDPDSTGEYINVADLMLSQTMTQFWDGIDESDFDNPGGFLTPGFSASVTPASVTDTSLSIAYDPVGGWWYVDFLLTENYPEFGLSASYIIKDSVRYETDDGTAQMVPDEETTHRVLQKASIAIVFGFGGSGNSIQFDVQATSNVDAAGLNTSVVDITGDGTYTFGITADTDEGTVDMTIGMESSWDNVSISDPTSDNPCPTSGGISGNFTLDLDVQDNTGHYQANGTWDIGINFTGGGNTTVNVQSGDFQESFSGNICSK